MINITAQKCDVKCYTWNMWISYLFFVVCGPLFKLNSTEGQGNLVVVLTSDEDKILFWGSGVLQNKSCPCQWGLKPNPTLDSALMF